MWNRVVKKLKYAVFSAGYVGVEAGQGGGASILMFLCS